jgi:Ca2+/Na+ antiporter
MLHQIMVVLYASAAVLCFVFGALILFPHLPHHSRLTQSTYYIVTLIAMIVFLAGAILAHVGQLDGLERAIFAGLCALSLYMLFRGRTGPHGLGFAARQLVAHLHRPRRLHAHLTF